ncbi:HEAT repeat domain-containing protein [Telmatocola sphagniphila]|uniref:HEAT repeat domain-containing protein n=1 Tax=Telmatocola sphagniphila TaxID=1123043 RepID=A0A8E6B8N2_9BACT|nr:HEAT repeat domain-containing protein [Telmatocola sphagniphila]QVL33928.1 HEAT repeat domain-containing protein [Telmatocola sphagniphila]
MKILLGFGAMSDSPSTWFLELGRPYSNYLVLTLLLLVFLGAALLYQLGFIGWVASWASRAMRTITFRGFRLWESFFSWASWPIFLLLTITLILVGNELSTRWEMGTLLCSLTVLFMGGTSCLAYMFIDLERYEVERGYKAVHNPLKGQDLAFHLISYGHQVGIPLLICATIGTIGGFALFNLGLYNSGGHSWYELRSDQGPAVLLDFFVSTLLNLLRVVDVLNLANSRHILRLEYVSAVSWPATLPLLAFKSFFTLVLLQQILASLRLGRLLSETIKDFWSPHEPIYQRARNSLPQFGTTVIRPLLSSLRSVPMLPREQRDQLPLIISTIGPSAIPSLIFSLRDEHEHVRAVSAASLGLLRANNSLRELLPLATESSELVRKSVIEALGTIARSDTQTSQRPTRRLLFNAGQRNPFFGWRPQNALLDPVKAVLPVLETALSDSLPAVRIEAVRALGALGPQVATAVTPKLLSLLRDPDETVRCEAAATIGILGDPQGIAVEPLGQMLDEASLVLKATAARALGQLGAAASSQVLSLVTLLQNPEESVRSAAAEAIAQIGTLNVPATDSLIEGLSNPDNLVRAQTAQAVGTMGEVALEVAPALVEAMSDENDVVRARAVEALGKMGEMAAEVAVPSLVHALRDSDNWVSALAAEALGQMKGSADEAIPALIRSLSHVNVRVRCKAAEALGQMGDDTMPVCEALRSACRDVEGSVRGLALRSLSLVSRNPFPAGNSWGPFLEDEDPRVRVAALEAVGRLGEIEDPSLLPQILGLLDDPNDDVKIEVTKVLPLLGGDPSSIVIALTRRLETDDNDWVREHAAKAIGKFGAVAASAGPALLKASRGGEVGVREQALRAIVMIQPPEALEAFAAGLTDPSPDIRKLASAGWMKMPVLPAEVIPELIEALGDPENQVRANAAHALGRLEKLPEESVERLIECASDPDDGLRLGVAIALQASRSSSSRATLGQLLKDTNPKIRLIAAGALLAQDVDSEEGKAVLAESLEDPVPRIRRAALNLIDSLGEKGRSFFAILQLRQDQEEDVEARAILLPVLEKLLPSNSTQPQLTIPE